LPKLSAISVKNAKPGRHADGNGLYLIVKETGAKSWVLRVQVDGRRRDIGLGSYKDAAKKAAAVEFPAIDIPILHRKILTLSEAREKSDLLRSAAKAGMDPVAERDRNRRTAPSFKEAAEITHQALKDGWTEKGQKVFLRSLENHAYPALGRLRVDNITAADITNALAPIWTSKPDMARKVKQRIRTVLNFSHGKGWRTAEAPSRSVTVGLPRQPKGGNYSAMPYAEVPAFVAKLQAEVPTAGKRGLLFQIFTAARPGEVRAAQWSQIDFDKREWKRPAAIMKANEAHIVTLNTGAIELLQSIRTELEREGAPPDAESFIFPGQKGVMMSDMTMSKVLRSAAVSYDAHGFRSSFRDWAAEQMSEIPDPVAEAALAHVVPDKVVRAYKRTTFLDMRKMLLEAWGEFLQSSQTA
jgi:integrase